MSVILETSIGDLTIDLFVDECPNTCTNFLKLCKLKYYNSCIFHNVQKGFIAQSGDPTGTGRGGDSIYGQLFGSQARFFQDEVHPNLTHSKKGTVAMASAGKHLNASQFYITLAANLDYLDEKHTVFGEIAEGLDVLEKLNSAFCDDDHRPLQNIRIRHTIVLDDPFDDPKGFVAPDQSPIPQHDIHDVDRVRDDELCVSTLDAATGQEAEENLAERRALNQKEVLAMVGDLPDVDAAPPDNVLFVCKLNPVTISEDLELIFSRFGEIQSCEVIRDYKTGDSLQYAFIEFSNSNQCEAAYKKMENVLIDDRRIHVDFSQSVAHLWRGFKAGQPSANVPTPSQDRGESRNAPDRTFQEKRRGRTARSDADPYRRRSSAHEERRGHSGGRHRDYHRSRERDRRRR